MLCDLRQVTWGLWASALPLMGKATNSKVSPAADRGFAFYPNQLIRPVELQDDQAAPLTPQVKLPLALWFLYVGLCQATLRREGGRERERAEGGERREPRSPQTEGIISAL